MGGLRRARGADRGLRGQARRPAAGVDGRPVRVVDPPLPGQLGHRDHGGGPGRAARLEADVCRAAGVSPDAVHRLRWTGRPSARAVRARGRRGRRGRRPMAPRHDADPAPVPLRRRRPRRRPARRPVRGGAGRPPTAWPSTAGTVRAEQATAGQVAAQLRERATTGAMFGGGTLAIVVGPGRAGAAQRHAQFGHRDDRLAGARATPSSSSNRRSRTPRARAPPPGRRRDGGRRPIRRGDGAAARPPSAPWIEGEARDRGLRLAPGAARELADRLGSRVTDGDVERRHVTRIASGELDKLALRHASTMAR